MKSFNWYTEKALRTFVFQPETKERFIQIQTNEGGLDEAKTHQMIHAILGMVGESAEVMSVPFDEDYIAESSKEMGDWMWYAAIGADALGVTMDDLIEMGESRWMAEGPEENLSVISSEMAEGLKKWLFYGKKFDRKTLVEGIGRGIACIRFEIEDDEFERILQDNIAKLEKRFPNAFSAKDAIAKADA